VTRSLPYFVGHLITDFSVRYWDRSRLNSNVAAGRDGEGTQSALSEWYAPDTLQQLHYLWSLLEVQTPDVRRILRAVFSDVLFDCASTAGATTRSGKTRRHHWGWIADNVRPKVLLEHNAIGLFRDRLAQLGRYPDRPIERSALVVRQDVRHMAIRDSIVDLVVTSPPYIRSHRLHSRQSPSLCVDGLVDGSRPARGDRCTFPSKAETSSVST